VKTFALIGAAGYVAPKHLEAIKDTGNKLVVALDPFDSVGVLDSFFPDAKFFTEFERFDRHAEKLRYDNPIDYVSICSPNYLHDAHSRFALRIGADAICEKPTVLNPWNLDQLEMMESKSRSRVWNILQLRLHPSIIEFKKRIDPSFVYDVDLTYLTARGKWYAQSWKGNVEKSGGVATNIGIHFFDMLRWVFGPVQANIVHIHTSDTAAGFLSLQNARVRWFLSINPEHLKGRRFYRSIKINNEEFDFSEGFTGLHTESYRQILKGNGFSLGEVRDSIEMAYTVRNKKPTALIGDYHPMCDKVRL
jgi:UDP-N-acetyl-2-amino-2-deoxyglucuronate dehydrogenase